MKKTIGSVILLLLCCCNSYAQEDYTHFKDRINEKLEYLSTFSTVFFDDDMEDFDPDSLSDEIAGEIVHYLKTEGFDYFKPADFPLMEHVKCTDSPFEVLVIGYHCGGTAGWIPHSIVIKHTDDEPLIYYIESETFFYEFHPLEDDLFLCIGSIPGSAICHAYAAYLIDFHEETSAFRPVFNGKERFYACNSTITFDANENMLVVGVVDVVYKLENETYEEFLAGSGYTCFSVEEDDDYFGVVYKSKFNGVEFVKPEN